MHCSLSSNLEPAGASANRPIVEELHHRAAWKHYWALQWKRGLGGDADPVVLAGEVSYLIVVCVCSRFRTCGDPKRRGEETRMRAMEVHTWWRDRGRHVDPVLDW